MVCISGSLLERLVNIIYTHIRDDNGPTFLWRAVWFAPNLCLVFGSYVPVLNFSQAQLPGPPGTGSKTIFPSDGVTGRGPCTGTLYPWEKYWDNPYWGADMGIASKSLSHKNTLHRYRWKPCRQEIILVEILIFMYFWEGWTPIFKERWFMYLLNYRFFIVLECLCFKCCMHTQLIFHFLSGLCGSLHLSVC